MTQGNRSEAVELENKIHDQVCEDGSVLNSYDIRCSEEKDEPATSALSAYLHRLIFVSPY